MFENFGNVVTVDLIGQFIISEMSYFMRRSTNTRKKSPFLHCLINRVEISANNNVTHMQLIWHSMINVSRLRALQLSSRQCYIARTGAIYVTF